MGLLNPHLDDAAFADVWTERLISGHPESGRPAEAHLRSCADCRAQYAKFSGWLEGLRIDASAEADEVLGAERLAAQQAQILRRLEAMGQPARVIAFPRFAQPLSAQPDGRRRWVAAAAAAGLVVGVGLGQVLEFGGSESLRSAGAPMAQQQSASSDEAYLYDQDIAPSQARVPESLQYLNAITPSARDYDPR